MLGTFCQGSITPNSCNTISPVIQCHNTKKYGLQLWPEHETSKSLVFRVICYSFFPYLFGLNILFTVINSNKSFETKSCVVQSKKPNEIITWLGSNMLRIGGKTMTSVKSIALSCAKSRWICDVATIDECITRDNWVRALSPPLVRSSSHWNN